MFDSWNTPWLNVGSRNVPGMTPKSVVTVIPPRCSIICSAICLALSGAIPVASKRAAIVCTIALYMAVWMVVPSMLSISPKNATGASVLFHWYEVNVPAVHRHARLVSASVKPICPLTTISCVIEFWCWRSSICMKSAAI